MAYSADSFSAGEQPTLAKWNKLWANDAAFNNGTGIANIAWNTTSVSNPYKFRASRNAAANSGNGAFADVAYDTEQYDTNSNLSSGTYTVPATGYYQFNWSVSFAPSSARTMVSSLFKNGTQYSDGGQLNNFSGGVYTGYFGSHGSDIIPCTAGDTIKIAAYADSTCALQVANIYSTYFSGFLVSIT